MIRQPAIYHRKELKLDWKPGIVPSGFNALLTSCIYFKDTKKFTTGNLQSDDGITWSEDTCSGLRHLTYVPREQEYGGNCVVGGCSGTEICEGIPGGPWKTYEVEEQDSWIIGKPTNINTIFAFANDSNDALYKQVNSTDGKWNIYRSIVPKIGIWKNAANREQDIVLCGNDYDDLPLVYFIDFKNGSPECTNAEFNPPLIDGVDWVAYGNGFYVIMTATGNVYRSQDGKHFNIISDLPERGRIFFAAGHFFAFPPGSSNVMYYSDDLIGWKVAKMPNACRWNAFAYGNGRIVVFASDISYMAYADID